MNDEMKVTGDFTTHHAGRPHCLAQPFPSAPGEVWLMWRHPDGEWVTECQIDWIGQADRGEESGGANPRRYGYECLNCGGVAYELTCPDVRCLSCEHEWTPTSEEKHHARRHQDRSHPGTGAGELAGDSPPHANGERNVVGNRIASTAPNANRNSVDSFNIRTLEPTRDPSDGGGE